MQEDFVSGMRRQVGWFVIFGIGILLLLLLVTSIRTNVFAKQFYIYFFPPSAGSFYEGQPVKFQGFAIGHVDQIELEREGKVKITLSLLDRYRHMIHKTAVARMIKEGLIGEQVVEVTAGEEDKATVNEGDIIGYETEASFEQLLADLKPAVGNANVLLRELATLSVWLNDPYGDVREAMAGFREATKGVRGDKVGKMLDEFTGTLTQLKSFASDLNKQQVAEELSDSLRLMKEIFEDLHPMTEAIGQDGAVTVEHLNTLISNLDQLSRSLNIVATDLSEMTPELPGLARESREAIEEINGLIKNLEGSWLFGGGGTQKSGDDAVAAPPALDMRP